MKKNDVLILEIIDITNEGTGVGKIDSFPVFVPFTALGDRVKVLVLKVLSSYAFGKVLEVLSPSPDREESSCEAFSKCGGCTYFHIRYEAEKKAKQKQVSDALRKIGGFSSFPMEEIVGGTEICHYRNKAQFPLGVQNGKIIAGFYAPKSHRIIEVRKCSIQDERANKALSLVLSFANEKKLSVYDEETNKGLLRHVYIRVGKRTNEVQLCLVINANSLPFEQEFVAYMTSRMPELSSILLNHNKKKGNVILGNKNSVLYGTETIRETLGGVSFDISPLSFFQVNPIQAETLYALALEKANITKEDTVLDLFCGIGTITLLAAKRAKRAVGVEIVSAAVENAKQNAKQNKIENAEFYLGPAEDITGNLAKDKIEPDVIILDPPRKGCELSLLSALKRISPSRIVYISCDMATMARDAKILCEEGVFSLESVTPVDMFPRTKHCECVLLLTRQK